MIIQAPYTRPIPFTNGLINNYSLLPEKQWSSLHLCLPGELGTGGLRIFTHQNLHFYRGKWKFYDSTGFQALDEVGTNDLIDFRISRNHHMQSAYVQGVKKFAWDVTQVDGIRMFIPKALLPSDRRIIDKKIEQFILNRDINLLIDKLFDIDPTESNNTLLLEAKFLELIHYFIQHLNKGEVQQLLENTHAYEATQIETAKEILDNQLHDPPCIKALSKEIGLNTRKLKAGFRETFGITIRQYVIQQRMLLAQDLVMNSDHPLSVICQMVGYHNRGHFASTYTKYFGHLPHQAREKHNSDRV
ncbi:MAG TPA: hypothetical protein DCS93_28025 [Microscillaceae bacterium]|nr:hypothetical protein [Microscillaceae bacterium]